MLQRPLLAECAITSPSSVSQVRMKSKRLVETVVVRRKASWTGGMTTVQTQRHFRAFPSTWWPWKSRCMAMNSTGNRPRRGWAHVSATGGSYCTTLFRLWRIGLKTWRVQGVAPLSQFYYVCAWAHMQVPLNPTCQQRCVFVLNPKAPKALVHYQRHPGGWFCVSACPLCMSRELSQSWYNKKPQFYLNLGCLIRNY